MNSWMSLVMNEWMNLNDKLQEVIPDCRSMQACSNHLQTLHEFLQVSTKPSEFVSKPGRSSKWKLKRRKLTGDANRNSRSQLVKHSPASSLSNVSCKLDLLGRGISRSSLMNCPQKLRPRPFGFFERAHSIQKKIEFVFVYVAILRQRTRKVSNLQTWQKKCNQVAPFESTWRSTWCKVFLTCIIKDQFTKQTFWSHKYPDNDLLRDSASPTSSKLLVRCSLIKCDATWKSRGSDSKNLTKTWARSLSQRAQREAGKSPECNRSKHWKWSPDMSQRKMSEGLLFFFRRNRNPKNPKVESSPASCFLLPATQRVFS